MLRRGWRSGSTTRQAKRVRRQNRALSVTTGYAVAAKRIQCRSGLYLMFLGPLEAMKPWNPRGIEGVYRFLQKVWRECIGEDGGINAKISDAAVDSPEVTKLLHETIKKVTDDIEALRFNTAISQM